MYLRKVKQTDSFFFTNFFLTFFLLKIAKNKKIRPRKLLTISFSLRYMPQPCMFSKCSEKIVFLMHYFFQQTLGHNTLKVHFFKSLIIIIYSIHTNKCFLYTLKLQAFQHGCANFQAVISITIFYMIFKSHPQRGSTSIITFSVRPSVPNECFALINHERMMGS